MDISTAATDSNMPEPQHHIVMADEVDQTGTDISPVSDAQLMEEVAEGLRQEQASSAAPGAIHNSSQPEAIGKRPELRRDGSAPPPPLQPPPRTRSAECGPSN